MAYLLDISAIMALLWKTHEHHERVRQWQLGLDLAICPLSELGYLRISTQPVFGLSVAEAWKVLKAWKGHRRPAFLPCDISSLETDPPTAGSRTTDFYLAGLAARHGMRLATLDGSIRHEAAFIIPA